jgi:hypothetical protein
MYYTTRNTRKIVNHDKLKPYRGTSYSKLIKQLERQVDNK